MFSCTSVMYCTQQTISPRDLYEYIRKLAMSEPRLWQTTNIWTHMTYKFMSCFLPHLSYCTQYQFEYIIKLAMSSASVLTNNKEAVIEKTSTSVDNLAQFAQNWILYGGGLGHNRTFWDPVQNQGIIGVKAPNRFCTVKTSFCR